MAAVITDRPLGHKVTTSAMVTISNQGGKAGFLDPLSLSTGDYVYIKGNVENYNGFWYVNKPFGIVTLKRNSLASAIDHIVDANVTVYKTLPVSWSCIHLPIIYKIESDYFPTNANDPIVSISASGPVGNYFAVTHSALSGADALLPLDFVSLNNGESILQVMQVVSTTITVLNFDGSGSLINMQKYRNNYHVIIKVYAGLDTGHAWISQKPYELAATLKFIPDNNNEVVFSINEILKSYIETRNNTLLATLPNNIDFFTQFYITSQEAYDESNGTDITINYESESDDKSNFQGVASNSILEFKNRYSGFLSEYLVDTSLTGSKFLTLFDTPTIFEDKYFDISFITNFNTALTLRKDWVDKDDNVIYTSDETITNYSKGVYRLPLIIEHGCTFENVHPAVYTDPIYYINETTFTPALGGFTQTGSGPNTWVYNGGPNPVLWGDYMSIVHDDINVPVASHTISIPQGTEVRIRFALYQGIAGTVTIHLQFVGVAACISQTILVTQGPVDPLEYDFNVVLDSGVCDYTTLNFWVDGSEQVGNYLDLDYIIIESIIEIVTPSYTTIDQLYLSLQILNGSTVLTESKLLNVNCDCVNQSLYLTWLNNLGGFDYWDFRDGSDFTRNIKDSGETKTNIFPTWPNSYGENASEIRKQTYIVSNKGILVRAQHLTLEELQAIEYIKSSILVEIMLDRTDRRRVILDKNSWVSYKDIDKLYTLSFTLEYTNDIPVQRL